MFFLFVFFLTNQNEIYITQMYFLLHKMCKEENQTKVYVSRYPKVAPTQKINYTFMFMKMLINLFFFWSRRC